VSESLLPGKPTTLAVCFDRPIDHAQRRDPDFLTWGDRREERVLMRKAQFSYGWDWGPRLPNVGLWRPVELRREQRAILQGVHFYTVELDRRQSRALVAVRVEVECFATNQPLTARVQLAREGVTVASGNLTLEGHGESYLSNTAYLTVDRPDLWWTYGLGHAEDGFVPSLYDLTVTLEQDGITLDQQAQRVGIRTLVLDQSPDPAEPGTRFFRFVLNGVPIFAKGADWIPADSFIGEISPAHYRKLLTAARDGNMNMLRIWGGGFYEHDVFYDLCDELGLLIWQDFMFACAPYPESDELAREVEDEARYQVRRLRSHACMALWCGNNENQWIHDQYHWNHPGAYVPGQRYYDEILPHVVADLDGQTPYWPGSPYGGNDHNSMMEGDRHNWDVWHGSFPRQFGDKPHTDHGPDGVSYLRYAQDRGRFISEFGMHAAPVYETLRRNIPADQLFHHSPSMDHHNKDNPKNKGDNLMLNVTGLPHTLDEYIDFSMIAQAEGLKFGIEHFRRRKPHCAGTLFWQLNDCWPVLSWAVIDYYGVGKAGYFYAKRVYSPVLASFKEAEGVELWITNDTLEMISETITVRLAEFGGRVIWERNLEIDVPPNSSERLAYWDDAQLEPGPDRYLSVCSSSGTFPTNRHFFVPVKDLQRESVLPEMAITTVDAHTLRVDLRAAAGYAYFVHLVVPHEATLFSDNYFDLEAGERRTITITNPAIDLTPDLVTLRAR
jgi:beta-mannosidase